MNVGLPGYRPVNKRDGTHGRFGVLQNSLLDGVTEPVHRCRCAVIRSAVKTHSCLSLEQDGLQN